MSSSSKLSTGFGFAAGDGAAAVVGLDAEGVEGVEVPSLDELLPPSIVISLTIISVV
jgi:hypothetical protein